MATDPQHLLPSAPASAGKNRTLIYGIVGFILGIAVATASFGGFGSHKKDDAAAAVTASSSSEYASDIVSVSDQSAGSYVIVDSVDVPAPGVWVAVKEMRGSDLGNVLGANRVLGPAKNVTVNLLRDTLPGQRYAVVLYRDDGDEEFDVHKDSVYVDWDSGKSIAEFFTAL